MPSGESPDQPPQPGPENPSAHPREHWVGSSSAHSHPSHASPGVALAAAPSPPTRFDIRRVLSLSGIVVGIALCGLAVLVYLGRHIGPVALAVGVVSAVLPVPLLVLCFFWLDRYEPKPLRYLAFCFAWGAGVATAVSLFVNNVASQVFEHHHLNESLVAVVVAPVIEETAKAIGPVILVWRRRRAFSGLIDGIVLCGLSAAGFAMVENILYLGGFGYAQPAQQGGALVGAAGVVRLFFARIVMSGFAHPLFTIMTGIGVGIALRTSRRHVRWLGLIGGIVGAMTLHAAWNTMATVTASTKSGYVILYGYVSVMMPIFFSVVGFILWLRASEARLAEKALTPYVRAGWFSPPEVASLTTFGRRSAARVWARRVAGEAGAKAMRAYQFEATKLALLRDGMRRGLRIGPQELPAAIEEERRLLLAVCAYRHVFAGLDPRVPQTMWDGSRYHIMFPDGMVRQLDAPTRPVVPVPVMFYRPPIPGYPGPGHPMLYR